MRRYEASYTIEATVVVSIATMVLVYMIMLSLYVADVLVTKNVEIMEATDYDENYYYYTLVASKEINISRKLSDCFTNTAKMETGRQMTRLNDLLVASKVNAALLSRSTEGITSESYQEFKCENRYLRQVSVKETVASRNEADFVRGINSLCGEVFSN